jgi:hypothetical protein
LSTDHEHVPDLRLIFSFVLRDIELPVLMSIKHDFVIAVPTPARGQLLNIPPLPILIERLLNDQQSPIDGMKRNDLPARIHQTNPLPA